MILYNIQKISKSFSGRRLFEGLSITISQDDRIGLIGLNGSGKSTLLKILAALEHEDEGTLSPKKELKLGYIPQNCLFPDLSPFEIVYSAMDPLLPEYERERLAREWLGKLGFTGEEPSAEKLSGGWKKRLMVAQEMAKAPDILLLDEPTNHLDLEGVLFLEKFLLREVRTYLLVSHDRLFLEHLTNRMIELSSAYPKGLFAVDGSYSQFLERKEDFLAGQLEAEGAMASKLRREEEWLKSTPQARTTKSKARIDAAYRLIDSFSSLQKRNQKSTVSLQFSGSERETKKLVVAKNLAKSLGEKRLFHSLDFVLSPGTRLGLLGPNGSGKTTLLKLLADELEPDVGTVKRADLLQVVYFDQHRNQLPDNITLREALSPNGDYVLYQGKPVHVNGWCKRFLFTPDRLDLPIGKLSGGERARIAIAHLMVKPADLLLLDEPTNDLDIPTLEILEENLLEFPGALVLICHDRYVMRRLCTSYLALGNDERHPPQFFADYTKWEEGLLTYGKEVPKTQAMSKSPSKEKPKLSFAEKKELEGIVDLIASKEAELKKGTHLLGGDPAISDDPERLQLLCAAISLLETQLEELYLRWEFLENKKGCC